MAIPYRPLAKSAATVLVGYLEVVGDPTLRGYFGGLLIADGRGQPVEFVHNCVDSPSGMLWAPSEVRRVAVQSIAHSLFDACSKSPSLLIGLDALGSATYCSVELAPSIPFALVSRDAEGEQVSLAWTATPRSPLRAVCTGRERDSRGLSRTARTTDPG